MFNFEKINVVDYKTFPSSEKVVEFIPTGVDAESISKVLSLAVDCHILKTEAFKGYAEVTVRSNFKLMYLDSEENPRGVDYNADFTQKIECEGLEERDSILATLSVVECDVTVNKEIKLNAVIETTVAIVVSDEIEYLADAENSYKTMKTVKLPVKSKTSVLTSFIEDEVEAGEIGSILSLDAVCSLKKLTAIEGGVRMEGSVLVNISYTEEDTICNKQMDINVNDDFEVEGVSSDDIAVGWADIKNTKIVLQGVTGDNIIHFEGEIALTCLFTTYSEVEMVEDMFMLTNEVKTRRGQGSMSNFCAMKYYGERISGTAQLKENRAAAREIASTPYADCYVSKKEVSADGLTVEGIVNTDVIYIDENGYNSVRAEVPFSVMIAGEFTPDVEVTALVDDISARIKRDREIEINMLLGIGVKELKTREYECIAAVEIGEEKEMNTAALSMYMASEGDGMWELCKALTATPEEIQKQNPTLEMPLKEGDRVLFFRKLKF